jgi:ribosomal protein L14
MNRNIDRYLTSLILLPAVMPAVIVRQRKPWRRKDGVFMYFEGENAGLSVIGTPD